MNQTEMEYRIQEWLEILLRKWWMVVVAGFAGAILGLGGSMLLSPVYEAEAVFGVGIAYSASQPLALVVEDRVFDRVAGIILADETMNEVLETVSPEVRLGRGWGEAASLRESLRLDRKLAEWSLVVRDGDPQVAAEVANAWSEAALSNVDAALEHAWNVVGMLVDTTRVEPEGQIIEKKSGNKGSIIYECQVLPFDLDPEILDGDLQRELRLSRGLFPTLDIEPLRKAVPPTRPVIWGRGTLTLAGAFIGVVIGIWGIFGHLAIRSESGDGRGRPGKVF